MSIIFDIETGPVPDDLLLTLIPEFKPDPPPGEFDPESVKYGQMKDPEKKAIKLAAAKEKHVGLVRSYELTTSEANEEHINKHRSRAGLDPIIGQVLTIGYWNTFTKQGRIPETTEKETLVEFWTTYQTAMTNRNQLIGFNIEGFDLPFLVKRSWINGVEVPGDVLKQNRYWNPIFVDLYKIWNCGAFKPSFPSNLDRVDRFFGGTGKKDGDGAEFARLWAADRDAAKKYLKNDLIQTLNVARKMQVIV